MVNKRQARCPVSAVLVSGWCGLLRAAQLSRCWMSMGSLVGWWQLPGKHDFVWSVGRATITKLLARVRWTVSNSVNTCWCLIFTGIAVWTVNEGGRKCVITWTKWFRILFSLFCWFCEPASSCWIIYCNGGSTWLYFTVLGLKEV